ncbi:MAG: cytochrome c maturation protein CcmE [Acidimicrobiia bacterium]
MDVKPEAKPLDLTPRGEGVANAPRVRKASSRAQRFKVGGMLAVLLLIGAVVLFQGLANASLYFCNANEVGKRNECSTAKRFRLQGTVDNGSVKEAGGRVAFTVSFEGVAIPVEHQGDPPEKFQEGIPVVLEGVMKDGTFQSDRILVKHSEKYKADNPDRVASDAP